MSLFDAGAEIALGSFQTPYTPALKVRIDTFEQCGGVTAGSGPTVGTILNGASYVGGSVTPLSWIAIKGANLAQTTRIWEVRDFVSGNLPTRLDDVSVSIGGKAAYVYFVSPTQINVLVPGTVSRGVVTVEITTSKGKSGSVSVNIEDVAPGLFLFYPQENRYVAAVHLDGTYVGPSDLLGPDIRTAPARAGGIISLYATGVGPLERTIPEGPILSIPVPLLNLPVVTIGGFPAEVLYAGMTSNGLIQINVRVPDVISIGNIPVGRLPVGDNAVWIGTYTSQTGAYLFVDR
jgi:uncharacterized protein (TIGR03437 family)